MCSKFESRGSNVSIMINSNILKLWRFSGFDFLGQTDSKWRRKEDTTLKVKYEALKELEKGRANKDVAKAI